MKILVPVVTKAAIEGGGIKKSLPVQFNVCDHMLVRVPQMGTIVLETPFGYVTVCVVPYNQDGSGTSGGSIDIKYHGDDRPTKVLGFSKDKQTEVIRDFNLYALDVGAKKV